MTEDQIKIFEKVQAQLISLYQELGMLSKKSSNDALNKFKLKFINSTLSDANRILDEQYKPFNSFDSFDDEELPTTSDVTMILGQYLNGLENLRADNIERKEKRVDFKFIGYDWYWIGTKIKTAPPKKLK